MGEGAPAVAATPAPPYRRLGRLRFLLALLVLLWHVGPIAEINRGWLGASGYGPVAVMAFFVLSGFIVTEAILGSYLGRPFAFLGNRLIRLWPGYLAAVAAIALTLWASGRVAGGELGWRNLAANALALFPTVPLTDPLLGLERRDTLLVITWALRVEFTFYLAAGLVLLAGRRLPAGLLPPLLTLVLLASLIGHHLLQVTPRATFYLGLAPHFVLGVTAALWLNGRLSRAWALGLALAALLLAAGQVLNFTVGDLDRLPWRHRPAWPDVAGTALWLLLLLWGWWRIGRPASGPTLAKDRLLGDLTYNLYLFHLPAILLVAWAWPQKDWSSILPALALALLFAASFGWLTEPALRRWRAAVRGRPLA